MIIVSSRCDRERFFKVIERGGPGERERPREIFEGDHPKGLRERGRGSEWLRKGRKRTTSLTR